jgi:hypothetical protein
MKKITAEKQPFERLEISKKDLLRLFGVCTLKIVFIENYFFFNF